jgi:Cdc6-like AAA superfamily ATPase
VSTASNHLNDTIDLQSLRNAVLAIQERSENIEKVDNLSELFVDVNVLGRLAQRKNQVIFGRRGTGKTHILVSLKEHYLNSFDNNKILPIYINAKSIADDATNAESNPGFSVFFFLFNWPYS